MATETSSFGPFVLDRRRRSLTRMGLPVHIGHHGYVLLETLLDAGGAPVSKQTLLLRGWPDTIVEEGNLTVQISALRRQLGDNGNTIIATVPRVGYRLAAPLKASDELSRSAGGPPVVAVLPFANLGASSDDGYFADGVVEDIITALSRFKSFGVLSRGASLALRDGDAAKSGEVGNLGVRYALEGSVRRMGDKLRVTARLLDTASGRQLWAEQYDGAAGDIFAFQDRITEGVVGIVEPTIRKTEIDRVRRKPAQNHDAYDLFLQALPIFYDPGIERHPEAIDLLTRAMAADPHFALPPAIAAAIYEKRISLWAPPIGNDDAARAIELARKALALGNDDPLVRAICSWVLFRVAGDLSVIEAARQAVRDCPNHVAVLQHAAAVVGMHGAADEAFRYESRAYELSPGGPEAYDSLCGMAASELVMGNNDAAVALAQKSLATFTHVVFVYITLTAAYANLDRMDEARAMLRKVRELGPYLTIERIEAGRAVEDSFTDAVLPGLRKAGLPER